MDPQLKKAAVGVSLALAVSLIFLSLAGAWRLYQPLPEPGKTPTISAAGEAKIIVKPDIAEVSFSVVTQGTSPSDVQSSNDEKMRKAIDFLKSEGIKSEDTKTTGYFLSPQYDFNREFPVPQRIIGYSLTQTVSVKISDLEKVGKIVGGLTDQGVNQINNVSLSVDDPNALKTEARKEAITKARSQAEAIASGLGVKLGKIIAFSESPIAFPMPFAVKEMALGRGGDAPIEPGSEEITVTVSITYAIR